MQKPLNALVAEMVGKLDATLREEFEERAGIIEFQGNRPRNYAESLALLDVLGRHRSALSGMTAMHVELNGTTRWLLTSDVQAAKQRLALAGGFLKGLFDLDSIIERQYGGIALLSMFEGS